MTAALSVNGVASISYISNPLNHFGPLVFNTGDVVAYMTGLRTPAASTTSGATPVIGIVGEAYSGLPPGKIPFAAIIKTGASTYTVPIGKIARFMLFGAAQDPSEQGQNPLVGDGILQINGVNVVTFFPGGSFTPSGGTSWSNTGPFIAPAGAVISVGAPIEQQPVIGKLYINGWLYNAT